MSEHEEIMVTLNADNDIPDPFSYCRCSCGCCGHRTHGYRRQELIDRCGVHGGENYSKPRLFDRAWCRSLNSAERLRDRWLSKVFPHGHRGFSYIIRSAGTGYELEVRIPLWLHTSTPGLEHFYERWMAHAGR